MWSRIDSFGWFRMPKRSGPTAKPSGRAGGTRRTRARRPPAPWRGRPRGRRPPCTPRRPSPDRPRPRRRASAARRRMPSSRLSVSCRRRRASMAPIGTRPSSSAVSRPGRWCDCETRAESTSSRIDGVYVANRSGASSAPATRSSRMHPQGPHGRGLQGLRAEPGRRARAASRRPGRSRRTPAGRRRRVGLASGAVGIRGRRPHRRDELADRLRQRRDLSAAGPIAAERTSPDSVDASRPRTASASPVSRAACSSGAKPGRAATISRMIRGQASRGWPAPWSRPSPISSSVGSGPAGSGRVAEGGQEVRPRVPRAS